MTLKKTGYVLNDKNFRDIESHALNFEDLLHVTYQTFYRLNVEKGVDVSASGADCLSFNLGFILACIGTIRTSIMMDFNLDGTHLPTKEQSDQADAIIANIFKVWQQINDLQMKKEQN